MSKPWKSVRHPVLKACWAGGYLLTLVAILYGLTKVREKQRLMKNTEIVDSWKQWREAAAVQAAGAGPVQRKIPKSTEPPIQVLFTEHYKTIATAALIFGTFLYGMLYFFTQGMIAGNQRELPGSGDQSMTTGRTKRSHSPD